MLCFIGVTISFFLYESYKKVSGEEKRLSKFDRDIQSRLEFCVAIGSIAKREKLSLLSSNDPEYQLSHLIDFLLG